MNIDNKYRYKILDFAADCIVNSKVDYDKILEKILYNEFGSDYDSNDCWDSIDLKMKEISVTSEGQSSEEDLLYLLDFIEYIILQAKDRKSKTYLKFKNIFETILVDINKNNIFDIGFNEGFYIKILENMDLYKILDKKYIENWKA